MFRSCSVYASGLVTILFSHLFLFLQLLPPQKIGETIASSNKVTLVSSYSWECTRIGLTSGFGLMKFCPACVGSYSKALSRNYKGPRTKDGCALRRGFMTEATRSSAKSPPGQMGVALSCTTCRTRAGPSELRILGRKPWVAVEELDLKCQKRDTYPISLWFLDYGSVLESQVA